ncbi:MAG: S-methyl-5'-thioadenosine phosphorylase [Asgard group archaeon]|nr:S-methyl-5'-thioadenosine phosphorylase [Asgard group archaeon]
MPPNIALIGGSGIYDFPAEKFSEKKIETPYGTAKISNYSLQKKNEFVFLARHGKEHSTPPHEINFRANIYALFKLGIRRIIATSAVGSLDRNLKPGQFALPNQFIDFTSKRPATFFDGDFSVTLPNKLTRTGVIHTDMTEPYCSELRQILGSSADKLDIQLHEQGVYVCTEGPRFETAAEIKAYKLLGGTMVGMTSATECILARELGMCYCTLALITNFAAGIQEAVSAEEVFKTFAKQTPKIQKLISKTIPKIPTGSFSCSCLPNK